ncbi:MAG TPA: hypothetical protein VGG94_00410 [Chthoniobacterales bacterium]
MSNFFEEVKRRKVYRVAVAYVIAAGGIIQLASAAFPAWELPNWSLRLVIVLLLIGFPIALILAWAFDVTPEGIKATPAPVTAGGGYRRRNLILLILGGVVISAAAGFFLIPRAAAHKVDKSIAVLPFENLSDDKENAYFSDGIQDDVLTNLSKISDLKVISRTSVMGYRGQGRNVREIGKALGVATILEGSVRRAGNKVRVNVQLIDATNDQHLWAEDYDGDLTDVFKIQTDLAHKIADSLQARLSPNEKARMDARPTENSEAYLAFVQGHDYFNRPDQLLPDLEKAENLFQRAVELDPKFAAAYAQLSSLESWIYQSFDRSPTRRDKARVAANEAVRLAPDLAETHLALGYLSYYIDRDYERALREFKTAQADLPNDSVTYMAIAAIQRRQGHWQESTAGFEKAVTLNPKAGFIWENLAINYLAVRDFAAAEKTFDRGMRAAPQSITLNAMRAMLQLDWKGDVGAIEKALAAIPPDFDPQGIVTSARFNYYVLSRRYPEALQVIQQSKRETFHDISAAELPRSLLLGRAYELLHDGARAREAYQEAAGFVEAKLREAPEDASWHALLGQIYASLDRKDDAVREGKRAVELLPESVDALDGPPITANLAQIYATIGDRDAALPLIEHLLQVPAGLTTPTLRLDPIWDPLRADPRFQALLEKYPVKT